ncbi:hypothetical protein BDY21DRAFT_374835 [Lineolata rhizophorae]|uniref:F-box domain-containing protein n=1 Tax=Lineolata rhizophorae TaxID=578093 RepID=A0A6A6NP11_9PEZI|nr:hypothetical protein BDY21DRAFT_374835 [Lineolata rhizophorae]
MPSPFGPADHLAEGKLLYKRADFQNALDAFNSALQFAPHDLVLLDCRAATREKLGNLDEALRDAKSMIRISRADGRGYLRAGKLLSIMAKTDAALSIYDYGLRQVPDTDPTHEALRRMKNKTANATKGRDPLEVLPVELAENIMRCLPFRDVVRCLRVSKGWHRFIASRSCLWESLDLSQARKNVHTAFLMSCFANSKGRLIDASIQQLSQPALVYLVKYCPRSHLTYLRITSQMSEVYVVKTVCQAPNLKDLFVAGQVEFLFSDLVSILSACPNLAKLTAGS